ncbi:MAG: septum formation initiator family protein [Actinomycetota bacterium]|nr:septum formation initiator family protein [Actinomycetota bacterium]
MSEPDTEVRPREQVRPAGAPPVRPSFTGRAVILAIVAGILLVTLAVPVRAWFAQRATIATLRADVESAQQRVEELQVSKERWEDPAFVAAEARRRLHFVLPGEVGFVTLGSGAGPAAEAEAGASRGPWYSELWGALRQADELPATPAG